MNENGKEKLYGELQNLFDTLQLSEDAIEKLKKYPDPDESWIQRDISDESYARLLKILQADRSDYCHEVDSVAWMLRVDKFKVPKKEFFIKLLLSLMLDLPKTLPEPQIEPTDDNFEALFFAETTAETIERDRRNDLTSLVVSHRGGELLNITQVSVDYLRQQKSQAAIENQQRIFLQCYLIAELNPLELFTLFEAFLRSLVVRVVLHEGSRTFAYILTFFSRVMVKLLIGDKELQTLFFQEFQYYIRIIVLMTWTEDKDDYLYQSISDFVEDIGLEAKVVAELEREVIDIPFSLSFLTNEKYQRKRKQDELTTPLQLNKVAKRNDFVKMSKTSLSKFKSTTMEITLETPPTKIKEIRFIHTPNKQIDPATFELRHYVVKLEPSETVKCSRFTMGRSNSQMLPIARDPETKGVSKKHLIYRFENDQLSVIDDCSINGTFLNDCRLFPSDRTEVNSGDYLALGGGYKVGLGKTRKQITATRYRVEWE